eukprot:CAMPEP_0170550264 /NCGR_PEP_ID=MMETSP0211-20121228/8332_1 /TAXON_ID=311385 /ORGANISM="Pseudokeronopsis sp., Strain OXSARD2" /LENGTH=59 /DNA_ID=CAMNT_0010856713 /DNA_START=128 /DNA_END=307 /DNA_ORIENTATION=-
MKLRLGYHNYFDKQQNFNEEAHVPGKNPNAVSKNKNTIINDNWDDGNTIFNHSKIAYLN